MQMTDRTRADWRTRLLAGLLACAVALAFSSCTPQGNSALVGKWKDKDIADLTEFRADGTFHMGSGSGQLNGKYKWVDREHIKLTFDGAVGQIVGASTWKVVVTGDALELTDPDGQSGHYQRQK